MTAWASTPHNLTSYVDTRVCSVSIRSSDSELSRMLRVHCVTDCPFITVSCWEGHGGKAGCS